MWERTVLLIALLAFSPVAQAAPLSFYTGGSLGTGIDAGIFGLVIAVIFAVYPQSVLSVWVAMPIAIFIGYFVFKKGGDNSPVFLRSMALCKLKLFQHDDALKL